MMIAALSKEEAMSRFTVMTVNGALGKADGTHGDPNHQEGLTDLVMPWVSDAVSDGTSLVGTSHRSSLSLITIWLLVM